MIATFYGRVSTDSEDQKKSISSQVSYFDKLLDDNNYDRPDSGVFYKRDGSFTSTNGYYVDEGFSGAKTNKHRKAFQQMMRDARAGKFHVIFTKSISRFGRNTKEILAAIDELRSYGIGVVFEDLNINTMNRTDDFKITIFAGLAEEESRSKSESVQFGKKQAYKRGIWGGREPFGYKIIDGKLVILEHEAQVVRRVFDLYVNEGLGLHTIASILNDDKTPTKRGAALWDQSLISKMLINRIYIGEIRLNRTNKIDINQNLIKRVPEQEQHLDFNESLCVIDKEVFELAQIEKAKRYRKFKNTFTPNVDSDKKPENPTRHSTKYLLSNLLKCQNCGGSLRRKVQNNKNRTFIYWICRNNDQYGKAKCEYRNLQYEENLIEFVKSKISEFQTNEVLQEENLKYLIQSQFDTQNVGDQIELTSLELQSLKKEQDVNFRLLSNEIIQMKEYKERNDLIVQKLNELETKLYQLNNIEQEIDELKIKHRQFIKMVKETDLDNMTNIHLRKLVDRIEIDPTNRELNKFKEYGFDPTKLNIYWNMYGQSDSSQIHQTIQSLVKSL